MNTLLTLSRYGLIFRRNDSISFWWSVGIILLGCVYSILSMAIELYYLPIR